MPPHVQPNPSPFDPFRPVFPSLPIVTADPPRRRSWTRYGGLFYLGIAGLLVLLALIGWFGYGVWTLRSVLERVYVLHDRSRPEAERIRAAWDLSHDPRVTDRQRWDIGLERDLPALARYVVAESLTPEVYANDPRGHALAVARSQGWPDWLRILLARPIAYGAGRGIVFPSEPLQELMQNPDPATRLWAAFALAVTGKGNQAATEELHRASEEGQPAHELARLLSATLAATGESRFTLLDEATISLRTHYAPTAGVWTGWDVRGIRLVPRVESHASRP